MIERKIAETELILNADGSVFHLCLSPGEIADNIILVGDQNRVQTVSEMFDSVDVRKHNREFISHTGTYRGKRISVVSTGIGTDNIDIVVNELDALVNIDLQSRMVKGERSALNFVRIGTSGALQDDIDTNTPVVAAMAAGLDGLLNFYADRNTVVNLDIEAAFMAHTAWNALLARPYFVDASADLLAQVGTGWRKGITASAPGFYGPQGRVLRLPIIDNDVNEKFARFEFNGLQITNYEMECSAIYGLSALLGHNALTVCNVIANRSQKQFGGSYKDAMAGLIGQVLDRLCV
jgi:uridine phosphorylase